MNFLLRSAIDESIGFPMISNAYLLKPCRVDYSNCSLNNIYAITSVLISLYVGITLDLIY